MTSVTVSLMSPNIDGAGVEPKGSRSSNLAICSMMVMQTAAAVMWAWIRQ